MCHAWCATQLMLCLTCRRYGSRTLHIPLKPSGWRAVLQSQRIGHACLCRCASTGLKLSGNDWDSRTMLMASSCGCISSTTQPNGGWCRCAAEAVGCFSTQVCTYDRWDRATTEGYGWMQLGAALATAGSSGSTTHYINTWRPLGAVTDALFRGRRAVHSC